MPQALWLNLAPIYIYIYIYISIGWKYALFIACGHVWLEIWTHVNIWLELYFEIFFYKQMCNCMSFWSNGLNFGEIMGPNLHVAFVFSNKNLNFLKIIIFMTSVMGCFYIVKHSYNIFSIFGSCDSWFFILFILVISNECLIGTHWAFQKYGMFIVLHFIKISINTLWKNEEVFTFR